MVGPPDFVELYMNRRFLVIDENSTVGQANAMFATSKIPFLIVTVDGRPKSILKDWDLYGEDASKPLTKLGFELEKALVEPGKAILKDVREDLKKRTAIVIVDTYSGRIVGTLSVGDLQK